MQLNVATSDGYLQEEQGRGREEQKQTLKHNTYRTLQLMSERYFCGPHKPKPINTIHAKAKKGSS